MKQNLEKFEGQKVATANLTNVKGGDSAVAYLDGSGGTTDYNQWIAHTNNLVFGGTGQDSWLWRLVNG